MNEQTNIPTPQQVKYLRYLAHQADDAGVRFLPINSLTRQQAHDWIAYDSAVRVTGQISISTRSVAARAGKADVPARPRRRDQRASARE